MKTLDEVIKGFECCQEINCAECPYANWDNTDVVHCNDTKKDDDALHYLLEYRTEKQILNDRKEHYEYWEHKYYAELEKNDPLSWDELKTMEGKPVWVEYNLHLSDRDARSRMWIIVQKIMPWRQDDELIYYSGFVFGKKEQGKTWQAYRKERT